MSLTQTGLGYLQLDNPEVQNTKSSLHGYDPALVFSIHLVHSDTQKMLPEVPHLQIHIIKHHISW